MTPRAIWKTSLAIGDATVPVKLYRAVEEHDVHFRLLHVEDLAPVKQRMVDPRSGEAVASEAIQRGVAVGDGVFVVVKPEEVEREAPKPSRTIELIRFVPPRAIDPAWYERPYVLGPDGSSAGYAALAEGGLREGAAGLVPRRLSASERAICRHGPTVTAG